MTRRAAPLAIAALWLCSCVQPETSILLVVGGDLAPGSDFDTLGIVVTGVGQTQIVDRPMTARDAWPQIHEIVAPPEGGGRAEVEVLALQGEEAILTVGRGFAFEAGESVEQRICLYRQCIGSYESTCLAGLCTPPTDADADADVDADSDADHDVDAGDCSDGTVEQTFGAFAVGCAGTVTFASRATLCGAGLHVCSYTEWRTIYGACSTAPTHHYWTDDDLLWVSGGGPGACAVTVDPSFPSASSSCSPGNPMRVCALVGDPDAYGGHLDPEGNDCNWTRCGYERQVPHEHFGGCAGNSTAGTLCCR